MSTSDSGGRKPGRCEVFDTRETRDYRTEAHLRAQGFRPGKIIQPAARTFMCGEAPAPAPCTECGTEGDLLCDAPVGDGKTCDRVLCNAHRTTSKRVVHLALDTLDDFDFCPEHARLATEIGR